MYDDQWIDNLIAWDERRKLGEPLPEDSISSIELDKFRTGISRLQATEWMTLDAAETVEKTWSSLHSPGSLLIDPMLGSKIGAFEIVKLMGSGGMGTVYAASRLSDYRQLVAIKVLRLDIDRRDWRERFERERQLLAELNHPHICRMLDGGCTSEGRPYIVMELIEGLPIDRYCE